MGLSDIGEGTTASEWKGNSFFHYKITVCLPFWDESKENVPLELNMRGFCVQCACHSFLPLGSSDNVFSKTPDNITSRLKFHLKKQKWSMNQIGWSSSEMYLNKQTNKLAFITLIPVCFPLVKAPFKLLSWYSVKLHHPASFNILWWHILNWVQSKVTSYQSL